nr:MAG TPA: hypothetical protein [Caudoviricetes sp.]
MTFFSTKDFGFFSYIERQKPQDKSFFTSLALRL